MAQAVVLTADSFRANFENGQLDRLAGAPIQTRDQHAEANPGLAYEDREDLYRAYRAGYVGK